MPRLLLKLSGEALAGAQGFGFAPDALARLSQDIAAATRSGAQIALVCGGGNLMRGATLVRAGLSQVAADQMGMLATCMNGLALADALARAGLPVRLFSAFPVAGFLPAYSVAEALAALEVGAVVVLTGGTGNPLFTTDTAACLRAVELKADCVLKATKVDGVYSADPMQDASATRYDALTFDEALNRQLGVMDLTAICLCRDHDMPVVVFNLASPSALTRIIKGAKVGTRITGGDEFPQGDP